MVHHLLIKINYFNNLLGRLRVLLYKTTLEYDIITGLPTENIDKLVQTVYLS